MLACPNCGSPLVLDSSAARCETGHTFDRGRGGYLNLLIGGRLGPSVTPGDTKDALAARRRFLRAGHYAPIAQALAERVGGDARSILDVGCGEGYYLSFLPGIERVGLDISKAAVQMAARAYPDTQFVVGSAYRAPILDASVDVVVSVFAPHPFDEFRRLLRPSGRWITVTPGSGHLAELRPRLDGDAGRRDAERLERRMRPPEESERAERLQFSLGLDLAQAQELFSMTPLRWQSVPPPAGPTSVTVDVWVSSATLRQ